MSTKEEIQNDIDMLNLTAAQFRGTLMGVLRQIKLHPELGSSLQETVQNLRLGIAHLNTGIEALNVKLALPDQQPQP